jgi:hypothetical protein
MLVELRVENHRSIQAEQALSFEPAGEGGPGALLRTAALYGANASGKSNVLAALCWMRDAVLFSARRWDPDGGVPREPCAWGPFAAAPSTFEVKLQVEGVAYEYGFVVDDERVREEWLFAWPHGRKQQWFVRTDDSYEFKDHFAGEKQRLREMTRSNALFLSTAALLNQPQARMMSRWFGAITSVNIRPSHPLSLGGQRQSLRPWVRGPGATGANDAGATPDGGQAAREARLLDMLAVADIGVLDIKFEEADEVDGAGELQTRSLFDGRVRRAEPRRRVLLQHRTGSGPASPTAWLPLDAESSGTQTLLRLAPSVLAALDSGGLVVIDELEASLHPLLARHLIGLFADPRVNTSGAQLLFSTHDTHLLGTTAGPPMLDREQVWLTEKDAQGATHIVPLSDYSPRKQENLERGYLQGRYGAIPFLGVAPGSQAEGS